MDLDEVLESQEELEVMEEVQEELEVMEEVLEAAAEAEALQEQGESFHLVRPASAIRSR